MATINNLYTTDIVTTSPIQTASGGLLDNPSDFPPSNSYKMQLKPKPGNQIQAARFKHVKRVGIGELSFNLSLEGINNSQTKWPSRFEFTNPGLGDIDLSTTSGFKEFDSFYKVVFEDSTNPTNDVNWDLTNFGGSNMVYMWIYFGKNDTVGIDSLSNITIDIDIDYDHDPITLSETMLDVGAIATPIINNITII